MMFESMMFHLQKANENAVKESNSAVKEITKQPFENYHLPDRTFSDFYCKVCISHMNSREMWASHIQGKRHQKEVKKVEEALPTQDIVPLTVTKVSPVIEGRLKDISAPVVGLKYITEIRKFNQLLGPTYKCFLCSANLATGDILIDHLSTSKHMLLYIKTVDVKNYKLMQDLGFSKESLNTLIIDHASKLEQEYGSGIMTIQYEKKNGVLPPAANFEIYEGPSPPHEIVQHKVQKSRRHREKSPQDDHKNYNSHYNSRTPSSISLSDDSSSTSGDRRMFQPRSPSYEPPLTPKRRRQRKRSTTDSDYHISSPPYRDLREKVNKKRIKPWRQPSKMPKIPSPRKEKPKEDKFSCYKAGYKTRNSPVYEQSRAKRVKRKSSCSRETKSVLPKADFKRTKIQEILHKTRKSSPSAIIKLLDKMAYDVTNDEECQRLEKIAKIIEASAVKYMISSLNNDQNDLISEYNIWTSHS